MCFKNGLLQPLSKVSLLVMLARKESVYDTFAGQMFLCILALGGVKWGAARDAWEISGNSSLCRDIMLFPHLKRSSGGLVRVCIGSVFGPRHPESLAVRSCHW